jgi:hypothetical protein
VDEGFYMTLYTLDCYAIHGDESREVSNFRGAKVNEERDWTGTSDRGLFVIIELMEGRGHRKTLIVFGIGNSGIY